MLRVAGILCLAILAGCVNPSATTVFDQYGREVTIVDTGIDPAGGTRLTTIGQFGDNGRYNVLSQSSGPGLAQTVLPSVLAAAGFVGGMQLLRPAEFNNQTSVNATNSGITAASNPATKISASTSGGANVGGTANTQGGSAAGVTNSAGGGAGGAGGGGGASTASPTLSNTSSPNATANPTLTGTFAPVNNSSNTSSPMFAPQFSPVITGGPTTSSAVGGTATGGASSAVTGASTATGGSATATGGQGTCQGNCQ